MHGNSISSFFRTTCSTAEGLFGLWRFPLSAFVSLNTFTLWNNSMEMYFIVHEGAGRKIPSQLDEISKHFKRMIILRWSSPPATNYSLFCSILYSALKYMIMSSNQGQIVVFCSVGTWGSELPLCTYIQQFKPIISKRMLDIKDICIRLC